MSVQVGAFVANLIKKPSHIFMISTRSVTWGFSLSRDNYELESWRKLVPYTPTELVSNPRMRVEHKQAGWQKRWSHLAAEEPCCRLATRAAQWILP